MSKRKPVKRQESPIAARNSLQSQSAWLSASGLPPELVLDQSATTTESNASKKMKVSPVTADGESASSSPLTVPEATESNSFVFKNKAFIHSSKGASSGRRNRAWKSLKQITAHEKSLPWKTDDVTYAAIEAPPSFKPAKKYSDLSGLPAKYTDPQTKLRYATPDEFQRIRSLPSDIIAGYLALRKANPVVP